MIKPKHFCISKMKLCLPAVLFSGLGWNLRERRTLGPLEAAGRTERRTGGSSSPMTPVTSARVGSPSHGSRTRSASPSDTCHTQKDRGQGSNTARSRGQGRMDTVASVRESWTCLTESLEGLSGAALQSFLKKCQGGDMNMENRLCRRETGTLKYTERKSCLTLNL